MSLYIDGNKPKNCNVCHLRCRYGEVYEDAPERRSSLCPFKELPNHGDLIDRDAFMERMKDKVYRVVVTIADGTVIGYKDIKYSDLFRTLKDEPVVLEANNKDV